VIGGQWSVCSFRTIIYESGISLTYYENFFRKKFSYCGGGRKPMKVYPFSTSHLSIFIRDRCRWTVSVLRKSLYNRRFFTYQFPISYLSIFIRDRCRWTVSVFGSVLYRRGILLTHFPFPTYPFIFREPCRCR